VARSGGATGWAVWSTITTERRHDAISAPLRIELEGPKRSVVSAVSVLAKATGSAIIAEGIESRAQLDTLVELGIPYGEGFYLAPPVALEDLAAADFLRQDVVDLTC
jgi:predicted signal transduction protein with EAL and GGDEF domain